MALLRVETEEQPALEAAFLSALQQVGTLHDSSYIRWQDLVTFILGWAQHRRPLAERATWQNLAEQYQSNEERKREIRAMGMTIAQGIFLEGKIEGKAEGKVEGKVEGKAEGARKILINLGRKKLGETNAVTLQAVQSITDFDRLERMIDAITEAKSWDDLLNVL